MANDQALRPAGFNLKSYIEQPKTEIEVLSRDEKTLAQGAGNAFWKVLKKHFDTELTILEHISETAITNGMPLEEIGRNAIVINQVKGVLRRIINAVEDAREAIDNGGGGK